MKIILNAGHTKKGTGSGAIGYINESTEARKIVSLIKYYLRIKGHSVSVVNVDSASSQSAYLREVANGVNKESGVDLFVSIHFNAGGGHGVECYTYRGKKISAAVGVCEELQKQGFRNRGVKDGSGLYVIKKTKPSALLVEVCFVDSRSDYELYKKIGRYKIAQAITRGILK